MLRQLEPGEEFQGYGFLSPTKVFVTSWRWECCDACTYLEVIDVETGVEHLLHILGATGESEFEVSPDGSCVAFNWWGGIWVFSASKVLANLAAGRFDERNRKERFRRVAEVDDPLVATEVDRWAPPQVLRQQEKLRVFNESWCVARGTHA